MVFLTFHKHHLNVFMFNPNRALCYGQLMLDKKKKLTDK